MCKCSKYQHHISQFTITIRGGDVRAALQDMERQMLFEMEQSQDRQAVPVWDATSNQAKVDL